MNEAVEAGCLVVAALNLVPGLLGLLAFYLGDTDGALVIAVGSLAAAGHYPDETLFYLYALLPLAIAFIAEQLRVASAQAVLDQRGLEDAGAVGALPDAEQHELVGAIMRRECGVMAVSALVVVFLALRAASTAHGF
jgi:hypothetical protein